LLLHTAKILLVNSLPERFIELWAKPD
jgi:hypothetical protein